MRLELETFYFAIKIVVTKKIDIENFVLNDPWIIATGKEKRFKFEARFISRIEAYRSYVD
ncbi:MAG: hypothetical protein HF970_11420 [ANME-2 cluster archaeon]|nr:hypothetical protein [ANME-2 cluster archaeon]